MADMQFSGIQKVPMEILTGKSTPVNDYWVLKLDEEGNVAWSNTYGGSKDDRGQSIIQTSDGGYAVSGLRYER